MVIRLVDRRLDIPMEAGDDDHIQVGLQVNEKLQNDEQNTLDIFAVKKLTESRESDAP